MMLKFSLISYFSLTNPHLTRFSSGVSLLAAQYTHLRSPFSACRVLRIVLGAMTPWTHAAPSWSRLSARNAALALASKAFYQLGCSIPLLTHQQVGSFDNTFHNHSSFCPPSLDYSTRREESNVSIPYRLYLSSPPNRTVPPSKSPVLSITSCSVPVP